MNLLNLFNYEKCRQTSKLSRKTCRTRKRIQFIKIMTIKIENIGGIWYINHKRLGIDFITYAEYMAINEFIKEFKENKKYLKTIKKQI